MIGVVIVGERFYHVQCPTCGGDSFQVYIRRSTAEEVEVRCSWEECKAYFPLTEYSELDSLDYVELG